MFKRIRKSTRIRAKADKNGVEVRYRRDTPDPRAFVAYGLTIAGLAFMAWLIKYLDPELSDRIWNLIERLVDSNRSRLTQGDSPDELPPSDDNGEGPTKPGS